MDFRILGPLEAYDDDGDAVELGGRQQRLVLAMLLLHANEVVSVDRLIEVVWGEQAPASAPRPHAGDERRILVIANVSSVILWGTTTLETHRM